MEEDKVKRSSIEKNFKQLLNTIQSLKSLTFDANLSTINLSGNSCLNLQQFGSKHTISIWFKKRQRFHAAMTMSEAVTKYYVSWYFFTM